MKNYITKGNLKLKEYLEELRRNSRIRNIFIKLENNRNNLKENNKLLIKLAEEYGIDWELSQSICETEEEKMIWGDNPDVCVIMDNYDEHFNEVYPYIPFDKDIIQQLHTRAYPISIDIHKLTSKNDLIDFVEKKWDIIESYLDTYRQKRRIRKRKIPREITDFLWKNRNFETNILKDKLDEELPNNRLVYYEIIKLIDLEKKRRSRKFSIGQ